MTKLPLSEVIKSLATAKAGCKEFDAYIEMAMYPNRHYIFVSGNYYKERVAETRNLLKCTLDYTTSIEDALSLMPSEGWEYDFRITHRFAEAIINSGRTIYSCRAPNLPIALCYLILQISEKEGYVKDKKGPKILSTFFSERDAIKDRMKQRKEGRKRQGVIHDERRKRIQAKLGHKS